MLDRDESALHGLQLSIKGRALLDSDDIELGDIRDERFVEELFERRRPQVVFHAAALKHLPLLETAPGEAVKTNVWGTQNVLNAAVAARVESFVNVSTDKAADPCSVLGHSKRLAEGLTAAAAQETDGRFMSVRFGNVLGSRGSVLTTFTAQIARGGPVTVTDPAVTRYFMTIGEAVQLVIQAGAIGGDGNVLVLDMGEPVAIAAMAQQLIDLAGKPVNIVYTGLRPGEKLAGAAVQHRRGGPTATPPPDLARAGPAVRALGGRAADAVRRALRRTAAAGRWQPHHGAEPGPRERHVAAPPLTGGCRALFKAVSPCAQWFGPSSRQGWSGDL